MPDNPTRGRIRPGSPPKIPAPEAPQSETSLSRVEHEIHMGLGDAILRLVHVESFYMSAVEPAPQLVAERLLLVEALNQHSQLILGMNCAEEGIPASVSDSVSAITHSARTSCCRIKKNSQTPSSEPVAKGRGFFATLFGT